MKFKGNGVLTESYIAVDPAIDKEIKDVEKMLEADAKLPNPKTVLPVRNAFKDFMKKYNSSNKKCRVIANFGRDGVFETDDPKIINKLKESGYKEFKEPIESPEETTNEPEIKITKAMNKETIVKNAYKKFGIELDISLTKEELLAKIEVAENANQASEDIEDV